jgi:hypothetical protein
MVLFLVVFICSSFRVVMDTLSHVIGPLLSIIPRIRAQLPVPHGLGGARLMTTNQESPQISVVAAGENASPAAPGAVDPSALSVDQLARLLSGSGVKLATAETIRGHIEAGAPTAADGRVNLVHYLAWLVREVSNTDGEN